MSSIPAALVPASSLIRTWASSASQPARRVSVEPITSVLALRVERAATSAARAESRPRSASAFSMSPRRFENARNISFGIPAISPSPLRGTSHESPRVESSARSAEWYMALPAFCQW